MRKELYTPMLEMCLYQSTLLRSLSSMTKALVCPTICVFLDVIFQYAGTILLSMQRFTAIPCVVTSLHTSMESHTQLSHL